MRILKKSTQNSLHQPKHHIVCSRKKTETYIKNGEEKSYEQTAHFDKSDKVSFIVEKPVDSGDSY